MKKKVKKKCWSFALLFALQQTTRKTICFELHFSFEKKWSLKSEILFFSFFSNFSSF
jgi:hypothetical protein